MNILVFKRYNDIYVNFGYLIYELIKDFFEIKNCFHKIDYYENIINNVKINNPSNINYTNTDENIKNMENSKFKIYLESLFLISKAYLCIGVIIIIYAHS